MKTSNNMLNAARGLGVLAVLCLAGCADRLETGVPMTITLAPGVTMEMVWIPPGEFDMGSDYGLPDERPVHRVEISQGFWLGKYEVTQAQFKAVLNANPSFFQGPNRPVDMVTWLDARNFCHDVTELLRRGREQRLVVRLPTEAEWEYACRAGTTTAYHTGNSEADLARAAWHAGNSGEVSHPVGRKQPNAFGLYDMHGNIWEWCHDRYGAYPEGAVKDPSGSTEGGRLRVLRGGAWFYQAHV